MTETLRDQRKVIIRAVRPDDKGLVIDGLNGVSPESIYRRFLTTKKEQVNTGQRPESVASLTMLLRYNGYSTAAFGKRGIDWGE